MSAWRNPLKEWWIKYFGPVVRMEVHPRRRLPQAPEEDDLIELQWRAAVQRRIERGKLRVIK